MEWFNNPAWETLLMYLRARRQELLEKVVVRPDDRTLPGRVAELDQFLSGAIQKKLTGDEIDE